MPKTLEDWKDLYYEQQALHTEREGMLRQERDEALRRLSDSVKEVERLEKKCGLLVGERDAARRHRRLLLDSDLTSRALREQEEEVARLSAYAEALVAIVEEEAAT